VEQVMPLEFAEEYAAYLAQGGQPLLTYQEPEEDEGGGEEESSEDARQEAIVGYLDTDQDSTLEENIDEDVVPVEFEEEFAKYHARRPRAIGAQDLEEVDANMDKSEEGEITRNIETEAEGQKTVLKVVDKMKILNNWIKGIVNNWEEIIKESGVVSRADIEDAKAEGRSLLDDNEDTENVTEVETEDTQSEDKETQKNSKEVTEELDKTEEGSEGDDEKSVSEVDESGDAEEAEGIDEEITEKDEANTAEDLASEAEKSNDSSAPEDDVEVAAQEGAEESTPGEENEDDPEEGDEEDGQEGQRRQRF